MVISGPIATLLFCGIVAIGVVIAIGACVLSKMKKIKNTSRAKWFMLAALCILVGELLLWFV